MKILHLALKAIYFDQIAAGTKLEEYRLCTPFWRKRLEGRTYDGIHLTRGYPPAAAAGCHLNLPWRGCQVIKLQHEHFGPETVEVFSIRVQK